MQKIGLDQTVQRSKLRGLKFEHPTKELIDNNDSKINYLKK